MLSVDGAPISKAAEGPGVGVYDSDHYRVVASTGPLFLTRMAREVRGKAGASFAEGELWSEASFAEGELCRSEPRSKGILESPPSLFFTLILPLHPN